jgi:RimJ/RimL family protein N-acetyltransferase
VNLKLAKEDSDFKFLYNTRIHPEVSKMLSGEAPKSYEDHLNYLDRVQEKSRWIFIAYFDFSTLNRVGYSQIYNVTEEKLEVGFVIHPDYQGWGLGKKIVIFTLEKVKELFPNRVVYLYVKSDNFKAIHIYKSLGFVGKGSKDNLVYMELE